MSNFDVGKILLIVSYGSIVVHSISFTKNHNNNFSELFYFKTYFQSRGYGLYVPCGGKTSDLSPGSTVGCGNPTEDKLSTSLTSPRTISPRTTPSTPETKASTAPSGTPPSVRITSRKPTAAKILNR